MSNWDRSGLVDEWMFWRGRGQRAAADTETSTPMTDGGAAASDGTVDGMSGPEPCVPDEGA